MKSIVSEHLDITEERTTPENDNPFLKLLTVAKKDKQASRSSNFTQRVITKAADNGMGISKSALRRRKRKAREQLKPKMDDLLASLSEPTTTIVDSDAVKAHATDDHSYISQNKNKNQPNITKQSGHRIIMNDERKNFTSLLRDSQFRSSPFAALKDAIANKNK